MKALTKRAARALRRQPEESEAMKYVIGAVIILGVAILIRMAPELRRYMKMRAM